MPDADQRLLEVFAGEADRAKHGARAGTVVALRQSRALPLQRRRTVWIRHGFTLLEARFYVRTATMRRHTARAATSHDRKHYRSDPARGGSSRRDPAPRATAWRDPA